MAKMSKECIQEALENLRNFDKEEIEQYVRDVFNRANSYDNLSGARALDQAMKEVNQEKYETLFSTATQTARNVMAYEKNAKAILNGTNDLRGLVYNRGKKYGDNISSAQKAELESIYRQIFDDLSTDDVSKLSSGKYDNAIAEVYDGKETDDPFVQRMADKLKNYIEDRNSRMITSGAMTKDAINDDRHLRAIHDSQKVMGGKKSLIRRARDWRKQDPKPHESRNIWKSTILKLLDLNKTFRKTNAIDLEGNIDMGKVDEILNRIYDNITTNKSQIFTRSEVANDREAIERKSHMFFVWKGLKQQLEYNQTYGRGNLFNSLLRDAKSTANKVGLTRVWGDNPYSMLNDLRKVQQEVKPMRPGLSNHVDKAVEYLVKGNKESVNPALSNFFDNIKSLSSMARLSLLTFDSVSDVGYQASFAQRMGINYWKAYTNQLTHLLNALPTEERKRIARLMKTQTDSHLGYMGRWANENNVDSYMSKINTAFFKLNGLDAFDKGNKIGMMHMMAQHLADNSKKSFDSLDAPLQKWVGKFLSPDEWDLLRKKNQGGLFTTDNADALTNAELRDHYQKTDKLTPLSELRNDLYRKVHSMFDVTAENSVLSPSEYEKIFLGQQRGTLGGEIMSLLLQFKAYPLAYLDRVLVQGFQGSDGATQKLKWAISMMMGTVPLSMMSMTLHNAMNGVSNPDWDEMNVPKREAYLMNLLAPSFGVFMGLLDPKNQNSNLLSSLISSPSWRFLSDATASIMAAAGGDYNKAKKNAANAIFGYMLPIQSLPFVPPFYRQIMGENANLEPGQHVLFGQ